MELSVITKIVQSTQQFNSRKSILRPKVFTETTRVEGGILVCKLPNFDEDINLALFDFVHLTPSLS